MSHPPFISYLHQVELLSCAQCLLAEGAEETVNMVDFVYCPAHQVLGTEPHIAASTLGTIKPG